MPRIFDNTDLPPITALRQTFQGSERANFCDGFFDFRGWQSLAASAAGARFS